MKSKAKSYPKSLLVGLGALLAGLGFSLTVPIAGAAVPPVYMWHTFLGSATGNESGNKVVTDSNGNIYIAGSGSFGWTGPGGKPPIHPYSGASDILVIKLNSAGVYQWHTFYGSVTHDDTASSLAIDNNGNIFVAGESFNAGWLGDSGAPPKNEFSDGREIVVLKLNGDGVYQWHTFHGTRNYDSAYGIVVDNEGNCYVAGYSNEDWGSPIHAHNTDGIPRQDIVVFKLNSAGVLGWNTFWGAAVPTMWSDVAEGVDYAYGIAHDNVGNLYITGISYNPWQGGNSNTIDPLHPHSYPGGGPVYYGNYDIVVLKLDGTGAYQWHTFHGGPDLNRPNPDPPDNYFYLGDYANIPVLDSNGNIFVTGYSIYPWQGPGGAEPRNPHSGDYDIVVLKLNSAGAYQWHTFFGSVQPDYGHGPVWDDQADNYYLAAYSQASWQGPGPADPLHPHSGGGDLAILKLNGAGEYQWHTFYGSAQADAGYGLALDGARNLIAVGASAASWQGDGGAGPLHPYSGSSDVLALKLRLEALLYLPLIIKN